MVLKDNAKDCVIKEQIVQDLGSGLTIQFERMPNGETYMRIFDTHDEELGLMPFGNREIIFTNDGLEAGAGTFVSGKCKPTWRTEIEE